MDADQVAELYEHAKELYAAERYQEALAQFEAVEDEQLDYRNTTYYINSCREYVYGVEPVPEQVHVPDVNRHNEENTGRLGVYCRLRPISEKERAERPGAPLAAIAVQERPEVSLCLGPRTRSFEFDTVLRSSDTQQDVFIEAVEPLLGEIFTGHEAALLAHGHAGSGKTYTIEGEIESEEAFGLVPQAMHAILQELNRGYYQRWQVYLMCVEIYNEELTDFLSEPNKENYQPQLSIREGRTAVDYTEKVAVFSVHDVLKVIERVRERRRLEDSMVFGRSSRAHCVYTFQVYLDTGDIKGYGKLHLVDLADSSDSRATELRHLDLVVNALQKTPHGRATIPFQRSCLTWLLQEALEGTCRTNMLVTASPAQSAAEHVQAAFLFAERARGLRDNGVEASAPVPSKSAIPQTRPVQNWTAVVSPERELPPSGELLELQAKVKYLSAELQRSSSELQKTEATNDRLQKQVAEAERRRVDAELLAEEREFVKANTVEFADKRSGEARALVEVIDNAKRWNKAVSERLKHRISKTLAAKEQVKNLSEAAEQHLPELMSRCIEPQASEVHEAAASAASSQGHVQEALEGAVMEQSRTAADAANALRDSAADIGNVVRSAAAVASEALDDRRKQAKEVLGAIDRTCNQVADRLEEVKERAAHDANCFQKDILMRAEPLESDLRAQAEAYDSSARGLATELAATRVATVAAHEDAARTFEIVNSDTVDLCTQLSASAAMAAKHSEDAAGLLQCTADDATGAAARRASLCDAIGQVMDGHRAAASGEAPMKLERAIDLIGEVLMRRGTVVESRIGDVHSRVEALHAEVEEGARSGEAAVRQVVDEADEMLTTAWKEGRAGLARIVAPVDGTAAKISAQLLAAVGALDEVRNSVSKDLAVLKQQRLSEQRIVQVLKRQQQALQASADQTRSTLEQATTTLEAVAACLVEADEIQVKKSENVMNIVTTSLDDVERVQQRRQATVAQAQKEAMAVFAKALQDAWDSEAREQRDLRNSMEKKLDEQLSGATGLAPAFQRLKVGEAQLSSAGDIVAAGGDTAIQHSSDAVQLLEEWASEEEATISSVMAAQERASTAVRQVQETASAGVDGLVASMRSLEALQDNANNRWTAARDGAIAATAKWAEAGHQSARALAEVASEQAGVRQDVATLRSEASVQRVLAQKAAQEVAEERARHQSSLHSLAEMQRAHSSTAAQSEATHTQSLRALATSLAAEAPRGRDSAKQAAALVTASAAHAAALLEVREAAEPALLCHESKATELAQEASVSMVSAAAGVSEVQGLVKEWGQAAQLISDDVDKPRQHVKILRERAEEWHESTTTALEAQQEHWDEFARTHGEKLQAAVSMANKAAADTEATASTTLQRAKESRELAEAEQKRCSASLTGLVQECHKALCQQHEHWKQGSAAEPLAAFTDEDMRGELIFEDKSEKDRPYPAYVEAVLQHGLEHRPTEAALVAKFHGEDCINTTSCATLPIAPGQPKAFTPLMRTPLHEMQVGR